MRKRLTKKVWVKASAPIKPMVKPEPKLTREQMIHELTENFTDIQKVDFMFKLKATGLRVEPNEQIVNQWK